MKQVKALVRDPVCRMQLDPQHAAAAREHMGKTFYFCSAGCAQEFDANPHRFTEAALQEPAQGSSQHGHGGCC